jgi:hypothetical protein
LRDAVAEALPATSSEVPLLECSASIDPMPFAATAPLLVAALTPPAPVRLAEGVGLAACACAAVLVVLLVAALVVAAVVDAAAVDAALVLASWVALEVADFGSEAVDSVEPAKLAAPVFPLFETLPAD